MDQFSYEAPTIGKASRKAFTIRPVEMNRLYCMRNAGMLFYKYALEHSIKPPNISVITGLKRSTLLAMRDGLITDFTLEQVQQGVKAYYWQLLTEWNQYNYSVTFKLPGETIQFSDFWDSDQDEIRAIVSANESIITGYDGCHVAKQA